MNIQGLLDKYRNIEGERFFKEVFEKEEYKPVLDKKADVVLDIGALAGEFSAYIYPKAGRIYAIEPVESYFEELESNIAEFNLDKIKPFKLALGDYNGECYMRINGTSRGGNTYEKTGANPVPIKTLAQFIKDEGIESVDILKIDIEGHERDVFNSQDFKDVADKIKIIIGEHLDQVSDVLIDNGFTQKRIQHNPNTIYAR